jgi:hypothetical protein
MPSGLQNWSTTAATNATADSAINWAEGMAPSAVNDSARAMMAVVAKHRDDTSGTLTTGGTSTAYTLTTNTVFTTLALLSGQTLTVKFNATNGASPTLNVDGLGAKAINTDTATAVGTSVIKENSIWRLTYDNSNSCFLLHNIANAITAADGSVTAAKLATNAVTTIKITDANITAAKLATDAVETAKIKDANVTFAKLASAAVAAQSDMETATSTTTIVTPGRAKYHPGMAKAWAFVTVSGTTPSVTAGHNVSGVVRNSTGNYTLTFSTAMSSANFCSVCSPLLSNLSLTRYMWTVSATTTTVTVQTIDSSGAAESSFHIVLFGDQ